VVNLKIFQAWQIAWQLGPRLNASGRIDNAIISYELLMTDDQQRAEELVNQVAAINKERQNMTEIMTKEIGNNLDEVNDVKDQAVLFAYDPTWPAGLLGLVAGKLKEKYYKPFFVMTNDGDKIKASGRSVEGINLVDSLKACKNLFEAYGGHEAACGFTLKPEYSFEDFKNTISPIIKEQEKNIDTTPVVRIDAEINLEQANWELFEILEDFEPYGEANWQPKFLARSLTLENFEIVGKDKQHVRLQVSQGKPAVMKVIAFGWAPQFKDLQEK